MKWLYPPYDGAPASKRKALEWHAGHTLTIMRTERDSVALYCLTCGEDVVEIERKEEP
jgi:hypothetical protein